jgi:transposase-like protein
MVRVPCWTPTNRALLAESIAQGARTCSACRDVGVAPNTFYRWLRHGRALLAREAQGHALTTEELIFVTFVQWIELADAQAKARSGPGL